MHLVIVSTEEILRIWSSNCTCIALLSTLNVVAISVTAIGSCSSDTNTNFFPLLPQLVNGPDVNEVIANEKQRVGMAVYRSSRVSCSLDHFPCPRRG